MDLGGLQQQQQHQNKWSGSIINDAIHSDKMKLD